MVDALLIQRGMTMSAGLVNRLTQITGNTDYDKIKPSIWVAQVTDIDRILTTPLYNKILNDFLSNSLTGDYLELYESFISKILVFYATADFVLKNSIMITNGGNFQHQPDNAQVATDAQNDNMSTYYRRLGAHFEIKFFEWIKNKNIPEYDRYNSDEGNNDFKLSWDL